MSPQISSFDYILFLFFRLHDAGATYLARHFRTVKTTILVLAHLSLFGFFFPEIRRDFGEWAANLLIFILFLSPLSRIFRIRLLALLMSFRREMGITMAYLATVHGVGYFLDPLWYQIFVGPFLPNNIPGIEPAYLLGIGGYFLTLPLLLTSNNFANRLLGGVWWKKLHRLVYGVFVFVVFHRFLIQGVSWFGLIQALLLIGGYITLKILAFRDSLLPLDRFKEAIGQRYGVYLATKSRP